MKLRASVLVAALVAAVLGVAPAAFAQTRTSDHIAATANTSIPVYDTAWHMFSRATPEQSDEYFAELAVRGFTGAWSMVLGHAPTTYNHTFNGGGQIGEFTDQGEVVLSDGYIAHVNEILDTAHAHGMQMGLVVAWQNLYLPGGLSDAHVPASDLVRGTVTTDNAAAYGRHMVEAFGDHPAVNSWVLGGDAGSNNTVANIEVWEIMADAIRGEGSTIDIGIHLPPAQFDYLIYQDVDFLDFAAPEIGHTKTPEQGQLEMEVAVEAYDIPVWMGEARYFNSDFAWVPDQFRNPGIDEMVADAEASKAAGVRGYLYGDAGRFTWCNVFGDSTPCDRQNIADSFGPAEDAVIAVFAAETPAPAPTTTAAPTTTTVAPAPVATPAPTTTTTTTIVAPTTTTTVAPTTTATTIAPLPTTTTTGPPSPTPSPVPSPVTTTTAPGAPAPPPATSPPSAPVVHLCQGTPATIVGTSGDDVLEGTPGDDVIVALGGDDIVNGNGGDDIICGNGGDDILLGGLGFDIIRGGGGSDHLYANSDTTRVDDFGAALYGGAGRDFLVGSNKADLLRGQLGRDDIRGYAGDDILRGGAGGDLLVGGGGADNTRGGKADDHIITSLGDFIRGGDGIDVCVASHLAISVGSCESF